MVTAGELQIAYRVDSQTGSRLKFGVIVGREVALDIELSGARANHPDGTAAQGQIPFNDVGLARP
ncbi:hypothetical protein D3C84_787010 [compost metagenome]